MTTRNLLAGPITLSAAKSKSRNVLHALQFVQQKHDFYSRIESHRRLLPDLIAHHLNTESANIIISGQEYWRHGSFNLCVPVLVDNSANPTLPQFVMIRFPLPYRVGEATYPGNSDEKINSEAATYAWLQENCPSVPIPHLYGFGLSTNQRFTNINFLPWWSRWFQQARRYLLAAVGLQQPSKLMPHQSSRFADLDVGYLLIETITSGTMLSESWDEKHSNAHLKANLQRDLARVMLSLASTPLSCIGSFRVDNNGYLQLDNRPLGVQFTVQENEGIPVDTHRHQIFTQVKDFILYHLEAFSNRLLHQPNAIESRDDAYRQMTSLAAANVIFPQLFRKDLNNGPFVFALTDLHRSNILVDDDWNITCIIDLEFSCSWPIEFLQPPYWLDGGAIDEIKPAAFAPIHAEFLQYVEREEALQQNTAEDMQPLSSIMRQGWINGTFWVTLAVMDPVAFTEIFYDRILCECYFFSQEELSKVDYTFFARFWRRGIHNIIDGKIRDRDEYEEKLDLFFANTTS
ncbi:hypothetical protein ED733_001390 [Metarhizium rileyi]|uniref:Aminoglycoside phosphotransferase domain-containing protein n=1 Tax=Metarhizium rileyi (strain RCEF 4871) TaxID=1649241 RepID=A0A5C6G2D0_METRR|nr:hypothetical protein ED733_001390 [Metarhizium rileyi]